MCTFVVLVFVEGCIRSCVGKRVPRFPVGIRYLFVFWFAPREAFWRRMRVVYNAADSSSIFPCHMICFPGGGGLAATLGRDFP